jgi:hypothetical protein
LISLPSIYNLVRESIYGEKYLLLQNPPVTKTEPPSGVVGENKTKIKKNCYSWGIVAAVADSHSPGGLNVMARVWCKEY